jgi:hypothetical protein
VSLFTAALSNVVINVPAVLALRPLKARAESTPLGFWAYFQGRRVADAPYACREDSMARHEVAARPVFTVKPTVRRPIRRPG